MIPAYQTADNTNVTKHVTLLFVCIQGNNIMWWNSFLNYADDHEAPHAGTGEAQQQQQQRRHQKEEEDEQQQSFAGSYSQLSKSPKWHLCITYVYSVIVHQFYNKFMLHQWIMPPCWTIQTVRNHASSFFLTSMKNSLVTVMRLMCIAYNDIVFSKAQFSPM